MSANLMSQKTYNNTKPVCGGRKIAAEGQDKFTPVRATALIGRWIESFPLIAAAHVLLFGYLTNPKAVQTMGGTSGLDLGFILASTHNLVI